MITKTAGVIQAKTLYFISFFLLSLGRERTTWPVPEKKNSHFLEKESVTSTNSSYLEYLFANLPKTKHLIF